MRALQIHGLRRYQGHCYRQVRVCNGYTKDGNYWFRSMDEMQKGIVGPDNDFSMVQTYETGSWVKECTIENFIYRTIQPETDYKIWKDMPLCVGMLVTCLQNGIHREFPEIQLEREVRSFSNGVLDLTFGKERWVPFKEKERCESFVACKHFDREF